MINGSQCPANISALSLAGIIWPLPNSANSGRNLKHLQKKSKTSPEEILNISGRNPDIPKISGRNPKKNQEEIQNLWMINGSRCPANISALSSIIRPLPNRIRVATFTNTKSTSSHVLSVVNIKSIFYHCTVVVGACWGRIKIVVQSNVYMYLCFPPDNTTLVKVFHRVCCWTVKRNVEFFAPGTLPLIICCWNV